MADGERYTRMMVAARHELRPGKYASSQAQMLALALEVARENEHITDKRIMRGIVKTRIKNRMKGQYSFIGWQVILWWILPKLVDWFVLWWFRDKERGQSQS